jgi:hypothetical protein|tara:strand:- start:1597 stop:1821 length:225 start_codon:yes stop_codon:yes gene_type:complete
MVKTFKTLNMDYMPNRGSTTGGGVSFEGKAAFQNPKGNQPDYVGKGVIHFRGENVPIKIAIWQNTYSLNIIGKE